MKLYIVLFLALLLQIPVNAQTKATKADKEKLAKVSLVLAPKEDIISLVDLGSEGFVMKTGIEYAGRESKVRLHKYTADLTKLWTVDMPKSTNTMLENYVLASPTSAYTYYIQESKTTQKSAGKMIITRIDEKGKTSLFDIKVEKDISKSEKNSKGGKAWPQSNTSNQYIAAFVDEENLYLLLSLEKINSKREVKKKNVAKKNSQVVLFKASHKSREISRFDTEIELESDDAKEDLFIEYLGHDDENIYVSKKSVSLNDKTLSYDILTLDKNGAKTDESTIEGKIDALPVPAINLRKTNGSRVYNNDYDVIITQNGKTTTYTYIANAGSFGCAQLDFENGFFYIYGLSKTQKETAASKSKSKSSSSSKLVGEANSFYILKYNFSTGELLSSVEKPLPKEMIAEKNFANPYLFINRNIWIDVLSEDLVRFNGVSDYSTGLHSVCVNLNADKTEYTGKTVPKRKSSGVYHRRFLTNVLATKMESTKNYQQFLKSTPDFRTKEYSVFAMLLGNKRVVSKNYAFTKTPHIEFTVYPISGAEETTPEKED